MTAWTVGRTEDGPWTITDGTRTETVPSHYDAEEVLRIAEMQAGHVLAWLITDDGFEGTAPTSPDRPLTPAQADHLTSLVQDAIGAALDRGAAIYRTDLTDAEQRETLAASAASRDAAYGAVRALEAKP